MINQYQMLPDNPVVVRSCYEHDESAMGQIDIAFPATALEPHNICFVLWYGSRKTVFFPK